ncbi:MAG: asparaginase domain-containing protein [Lachnospiraceae bacterium]|nr:asparaginase domain-containing protein [Lachnospiraceae bacterium]
MKRILLMLTGGTICSFVNSEGFKEAEINKAAPLLIDNFNKNSTDGIEVDFDVEATLNILSENMTIDKWNVLLKVLSKLKWDDYSGIIIAHGTDTLAFTASLLSIVLAGCKVPVFMVSSNFDLSDKRANGNENFKAAVELITKGVVPNVYVTYKNSDGITYLHKGSEITQCQNYTWNFYSKNMLDYKVFNQFQINKIDREMILNQIESLKNNVLMLEPYVGIDYSVYNFQQKKAVLHGLFHSSTACAEISSDGDIIDNSSVRYMMNICKEKGIEFYIAPFERELLAEEAMYSSTGILLRHGAIPMVGMTKEACYTKLLVAYSIFTDKKKIEEFLKEEINGEMIY